MSMKRLDLGAVSAYAMAVEQGYQGTAEEFGQILANAANYAAESKDAKTAAETAAGESAGSAQAAEGYKTAAGKILEDVHTEGTTQIQAISTAGEEQVQALEAKGTEQIQAIETAGAEQTEAAKAEIDAKGKQTLDSIPEDYTGLQTEVGELRNDLVNVNVSLLVFNIHNGYWTTKSGSKSPYNDACSTDPILVKSGQKYEIISDAYDSAVAYILFNSDGTVNRYENNTAGDYSAKKYSLTIPDGVTKMICSCVTKDNGPFSVKRIIENEKGIVPDILNRLDYAEEQLSSINTEAGNKNLKVLNEFSLIDDYKSISFEYTNQYLDSFGRPTSFENSRLTDFIDISDCDSILVTANCADGSRAYVFYDENKNITEAYPPFGEVLNESLIDKKVSIPINAKYIRVSIVYNTNVSVKKRVSLTESYNDFDRRISTLEISNVTDVLSGKKYVSCGDSFTQGDFTGGTEQDVYDNELKCYKTYPYWIAKRNNMTLVNEALCGSCLTHIEGKTNALSDTRYTLIPDDADYITIRIGLNDSSAKVPIGTIDDTENTTFYGAWNVVLDYLTLNRPNAKIGIIVESAYLPTEYRNACINVAQKWGIPYLDLYNDDKVPCIMGHSGVSNTISNRRYAQYRVSESNSHPNMLAHKTMSTFIENFLRSL